TAAHRRSSGCGWSSKKINTDGSFTTIEVPGASQTFPFDINNVGQISGSSDGQWRPSAEHEYFPRCDPVHSWTGLCDELTKPNQVRSRLAGGGGSQERTRLRKGPKSLLAGKIQG